MRNLLAAFIILLIASPLYALDIGFLKRHGGGAAAPAENTTNMTRGFEVDSDPSGWTETDTASKLNRYDTAQAKQGTHSMSITVDADGTTAYQQYNIGSAQTHISVSLWFYATASTAGNYTQLREVFQISASSGGGGQQAVKVDFYKSGTSYTLRITGTGAASTVAITTLNAWYRLELDITTNSTSTMAVYDAAGSQVGSTASVTAENKNQQYLIFGVVTASQATDRYVQTFDAIGVDWTDATTPLYPFTVGD